MPESRRGRVVISSIWRQFGGRRLRPDELIVVPKLVTQHLRCDNKGFQISCHLERPLDDTLRAGNTGSLYETRRFTPMLLAANI